MSTKVNPLQTIEKLVAENSRLHKEIQELRTSGNVDAYAPYHDAGFAFDTLKHLGYGRDVPDITLVGLVNDVSKKTLSMAQAYADCERYIVSSQARDKAVLGICAGHELDEKHAAHPVVRNVSKLRGTLEMVKIRLERLEKFNYNEEINQLHFDLDKFLTSAE
jgi:hypothetical protein